jgi:hypothetical protein
MRRGRKNPEDYNAKAKAQDKHETEDNQSVSARYAKRGPMEIMYQASFALAVIGAIAITILLYYHKQTWACWTTFATVLLVALGFSLLWQDKIWKTAASTSSLPSKQIETPASDHLETKPNEQSAKPTETNHQTQLSRAKPAASETQAPPVISKSKDEQGQDMAKKDKATSIDNRITNSPIVNSPGSVQAPGGHVTINQGSWLMSKGQQQAMIRVLQAHAPATIQILMIGDSDSQRYAGQIAYSLNEANWRFEPVHWALMAPGVFGVNIGIADSELRQTVVSAFKAAGIEPRTVSESIDPQYPNAILVGLKP